MIQFYDAFISYGRADSKDFATRLYERLTTLGYGVWFDQNDIPLGVDYQLEIDGGLERSHNFIFIMAPHSVNSPYCGLEVERAVLRNKRIIPLLHVDELPRATWQQRNPQGTDEEWAEYQAQKLHFGDVRNPRIHPLLGKINWIYGREGVDDFEAALAGIVSIIERHKDYVQQHTELLSRALVWEENQRRSQYLLVGQARERAEAWLKIRFQDEQSPCLPTELHGEYITESIKNGNNLMTQVFLSYASGDHATMEKIRRSLWLEGITVWTNTTDIQTGEAFQRAIDRGIEQADNLVYLLSPNAVKSSYCQYELERAIALHKRIIPILVAVTPLEDQPKELQGLQYIDLTDNEREEDYHLDESQLLKIFKTDEIYFQTHKTLLVQAIKWEQQHRNPSILLRGYNLQEAESWLKTAKLRTSHPPTDLQIEFLEESLRQPPADSLDVFVSYSRADSDFARKLNDNLQIFGKLTWFDQESIATSSADFQQEIYRGIEVADNFLFILSPEAINSQYCADEVEYAAKLNKRMITILYRQVNPQDLHPELAKVQWLDFNRYDGDFGQNFNELVRAIDTDREHVHSHTKWSQRAIEWEQKGRSPDLLLRGNEFAIAQNWLQEAQAEQKKPAPTKLQEIFLNNSEIAIEAEILKEKRQKTLLRSLLGVMTGVAILAAGASVVAIKNQRKAVASQQNSLRSQIESLIALHEVQLAINHEFEALLFSLQAAELLKENPSIFTKGNVIYERVSSSLRQSLYEVVEHQDSRLSNSNHNILLGASPDARILAYRNEQQQIQLWNFAEQTVQTLEQDSYVYQVSFSPDGNIVATHDGDGGVHLWTSDGKKLTSLHHSRYVNQLSFSPDGKMIASGNGDGTVKLWNLAGEELRTFTQGSAVNQVVFTPDSQAIAAAGIDGDIILWSLLGEKLQTLRQGYQSKQLSFSPDGQAIASMDNEHSIKLWNLAGEELATLDHGDHIYHIAFSPDSKNIATGGADRRVKLWDFTSKPPKELKSFDHGGAVYQVLFSPDNQKLISAGSDGQVKLWHLTEEKSQQPEQSLNHGGWVALLHFSDDGKVLFSAGGSEGKVKLWKLTGSTLQTLDHLSRINQANFSPDGNTIAFGGSDGTVKLLDLPTEQLMVMNHAASTVNQVLFSPNGQAIASRDDHGTVRLWDLTGKALATLNHGSFIYPVSFNPDGKAIATGASDGTVKLWDLAGKELREFQRSNVVAK
jgi:WD40 repeat protein